MGPKGKLVIIGGSVDRGSFTESETDLKRSLKFFLFSALPQFLL